MEFSFSVSSYGLLGLIKFAEMFRSLGEKESRRDFLSKQANKTAEDSREIEDLTKHVENIKIYFSELTIFLPGGKTGTNWIQRVATLDGVYSYEELKYAAATGKATNKYQLETEVNTVNKIDAVYFYQQVLERIIKNGEDPNGKGYSQEIVDKWDVASMAKAMDSVLKDAQHLGVKVLDGELLLNTDGKVMVRQAGEKDLVELKELTPGEIVRYSEGLGLPDPHKVSLMGCKEETAIELNAIDMMVVAGKARKLLTDPTAKDLIINSLPESGRQAIRDILSRNPSLSEMTYAIFQVQMLAKMGIKPEGNPKITILTAAQADQLVSKAAITLSFLDNDPSKPQFAIAPGLKEALDVAGTHVAGGVITTGGIGDTAATVVSYFRGSRGGGSRFGDEFTKRTMVPFGVTAKDNGMPTGFVFNDARLGTTTNPDHVKYNDFIGSGSPATTLGFGPPTDRSSGERYPTGIVARMAKSTIDGKEVIFPVYYLKWAKERGGDTFTGPFLGIFNSGGGKQTANVTTAAKLVEQGKDVSVRFRRDEKSGALICVDAWLELPGNRFGFVDSTFVKLMRELSAGGAKLEAGVGLGESGPEFKNALIGRMSDRTQYFQAVVVPLFQAKFGVFKGVEKQVLSILADMGSRGATVQTGDKKGWVDAKTQADLTKLVGTAAEDGAVKIRRDFAADPVTMHAKLQEHYDNVFSNVTSLTTYAAMVHYADKIDVFHASAYAADGIIVRPLFFSWKRGENPNKTEFEDVVRHRNFPDDYFYNPEKNVDPRTGNVLEPGEQKWFAPIVLVGLGEANKTRATNPNVVVVRATMVGPNLVLQKILKAPTAPPAK